MLGLIQGYEDVPFSCPKWPICHEQKNFGTTHYYFFHLPTGPFHCFKKFLLWIQSYEDASFLAQNDPFAQNNFFLKIINIILIYLLPTFIGQNFKKILPADPVMRMCNFWAQNGPFPQMRIFLENLLMSLFLSFMPIYMPQTKVRY